MEAVVSIIGNIFLYGLLFFGVIGMIGSIRDDESPIGREWSKGISQIGDIFWSVAGFMTALPYFQKLVAYLFTDFSSLFGVDPSVVASSLIVVDSGGYQLAEKLATSNETWILAWFSSAMLGCVMCFAVPIGLAMVKKRDHKYFALGILGGVLSTPIGVFIGGVLMMIVKPPLRSTITTTGASDMVLNYTLPMIIQNLIPLSVICIVIALALHFFPKGMVKGFSVFGKVLIGFLKIFFMIAVIEHYTGLFSNTFGSAWLFEPIIADKKELVRALEICGMVGMMLCGAYPMIYLIQKYFGKQLLKLGKILGFRTEGASALVGLLFNEMAMFGLYNKMCPKDKVRSLAFANCGAFILADQLTYTLNFQPNLYIIFFIAKIGGGLSALIIVDLLLGKTIKKFEKEDREAGIIGAEEYLEVSQ
ncbi:ethanolamine utilization protein EutH [Clostridioides difficile]